MTKKIVSGRLSEEACNVIEQYMREKRLNQTDALESLILQRPVSDSLIDDDVLDKIKETIAQYSPDSSLKDYIHDMLVNELPSTKEEFKASIQKAEPERKCPFRADLGDGKIECGKLLSKKGKIIKMSVQACNACQLRRAYIQKKEGRPTTQPSIQNKRYCAIKDRYLEDLELPCLKDINYVCPNTKCHKAVCESIGIKVR